jgi:hypothetical protein
MYLRRLPLLWCMALIALTLIPRSFGQAVTATLVGTVTDKTGAAIANARVTILEQQTGVTHTEPTNASGNYEFTLIAPGIYTVSAESNGFQVGVTKNVPVTVNTTVRVDVVLLLGSASQTVTVTDQAPLLQTDRADVSAQIEAKQVSELPLGSDRNFQALESLVPGVSPPIYDHSSFFDAQNSQSFQVNGQSELSNNLQLEGIDDNEFAGLLQVYIPPAEAIQTVDVETSNYAPEFGRSAGAVTNVILKSGTNQFHGSVYGYNSISATSARSYFNNTGVFPRFTNNYYGGTIGGPIYKNHTFFFFDFLRYSNDSSQYTLLTVPTAAFRTGDLSASPTSIYDPNTGNPDGTGRAQFVTNGIPNVIPAGRISPVANALLALIPEPNIAGAGFTNNYQRGVGFRVGTNQFDAKVDQTLRGGDHLAFRYSWEHVTTVQDAAFGNVAGGPAKTGNEGTGRDKTYTTAGEYTHVFSPTFFTEARLGLNHYTNPALPAGYGLNTSEQLGIPGANISPFTSGLSSISIGGYSSPILGISLNLPVLRSESNVDAVNNWTKILGNHSVVAGWEIRLNRQDLTQSETYSPRGQFTYAAGQTALNSSTSKTSFANDFASFLLDVPNAVGRDVNVGDASWRETLYFAFIQDTWQASPKLTLTYGVRWELFPPATPYRKGGFSQYNPVTNSLEVAGYGNNPSNLGLEVHPYNFEPRLGFAYRVSPSTVVRAGFGISHTQFQDDNYAYNYPVRQNIAFNSTSTYTPALNASNQPATLAGGFSPAPQPDIPANGIIPNASKSSNWVVVNTKYKDPYVMSYNLTIEQDLGHQWVSTIAYVGNQGRHIPANFNMNAGLVAGLGAAGQPEFATFGRTATTELLPKGTTSNYNSLQARLTHRYSNGLVWTSSYAWQKAMGYISSGGGLGTFDFYLDLHRDYSPLTFNIGQTYAQGFVYELPFGKGKPFLASGWAGQLVGGWQLGSLLHVQAGTPLLFTADASQLNAPATIQVPNQVKPFTRLHGIGTHTPWFDPTSFTQPVGPVLGNVGKNAFSGPGSVTFDASAARSFAIRESLALKLRMDAFNALNHPTFSNPDTTLTDSSFGQVTATAGAARTLQLAATLSF